MTATGNPTAALRACIDAMTPSRTQEETAACILAETALRGQPFPAASLETAACLWEAVCEMEQNGDTRSADPDLEARGGMIRAAREAMGSSALRLTVIGWTGAVDAAWLEQGDKYDFPFDWEFVPGWIARNVDWSNPYAPCVKPPRVMVAGDIGGPLEPIEAAAQMVDLVERLVRADVIPDAEAFAAAMRDAGDLLERLGIKVETPAPAPPALFRFNVSVTRDTTETATVSVEASGMSDARALAVEQAKNDPAAFDWKQDDCTGGEPYIADDEADAECGQCEGTGRTDAMGHDEECPVCNGTGSLSE